MATKDDIIPFCQAPWVIDKRLAFHAQDGQMLDGLTYRRVPDIEEDGKGSFPYLRMMDMNYREEHAAGAWKEFSGSDEGNTPTIYTVELDFRLSVKRSYGLFRSDPFNPEQGKGLMEWLALVTDAIESNEFGITDSRLESSVGRPVMYSVGGTELSQLAWSADFTITTTSFMVRGFRSDQAKVGG